MYISAKRRDVICTERYSQLNSMNNYITYLIIIISFFGCTKNENRIFWVDDINGSNNDFLFLAESTNIKKIEKDSLRFYLTNEEIAFSNTNFKVFQTIYKNEEYIAKILLNSKQDSNGRNYSFEVRTYSQNHRLIDKIEFAAWKKEEEIFCSGSVFNDLKISKSCKGKKNVDIYQITNTGKIVQLNENVSINKIQNKNFELYYSINGYSLDKLERHPVFRIKDSIYSFTNEQIWTIDSEYFEPTGPELIKTGIFRESSKDSIMQIINSINEHEIVILNDELSYWKTHNLSVLNENRTINFEVDYSVESNIHEVLRILNSYIPDNRSKLELF